VDIIVLGDDVELVMEVVKRVGGGEVVGGRARTSEERGGHRPRLLKQFREVISSAPDLIAGLTWAPLKPPASAGRGTLDWR
jgi:hypothetical protein